jgi:hypothetical protein
MIVSTPIGDRGPLLCGDRRLGESDGSNLGRGVHTDERELRGPLRIESPSSTCSIHAQVEGIPRTRARIDDDVRAARTV